MPVGHSGRWSIRPGNSSPAVPRREYTRQLPGMLKITKTNVIKWLVLVAVVLLQVLTVVLLTNTERFYVEKQQLLNDPEFVQGTAFWKQDGNGFIQHNGSAVSVVSDEKISHAIYQTIPIEESGHFTVSFESAISNVSTVAEGYGGAELVVVYRNKLGSTNGHGKRLFMASGTRPMAPYSRTLHLGREIGSVDIAARLRNASGKFTVMNLQVSQLQELSLFKKIKYALIALWLLVFSAFVWIAFRVLSLPQTILLGGALVVGLVGVMLPDGLMTSVNSLVSSLLPTRLIASAGNALAGLFGYSSLGSSGEIGKMGHFAVFLILGAIAGFNFRKIGVVFGVAVLAAFASLTEALQLLVVGRNTSINDFLIDVTGGVIGMGIGIGLYLFFGGSDTAQRQSGQVDGLAWADRFAAIKNLKNSVKSLRP